MDSDPAFVAAHANSFDGVAKVYDEVRPTYPAALFAHLSAQLRGRRVLEVGAGTGQATAGLVALGLDVTCVEPAPQMAALLALRTATRPLVRIEVMPFESFMSPEPFDAILSATAWHWTDPMTRLDRAAALLRPGGFLGLIWNSGVLLQVGAVAAVQAVYDDFALFDRDRPGEPITASELARIQDPLTWPGDEIAAHPRFEYLGTRLFPWQQDFSAADYVALLTSTSWFQVLDPQLRSRVLGAITSLVRDQFQDQLTMAWSTQCYDARRCG